MCLKIRNKRLLSHYNLFHYYEPNNSIKKEKKNKKLVSATMRTCVDSMDKEGFNTTEREK